MGLRGLQRARSIGLWSFAILSSRGSIAFLQSLGQVVERGEIFVGLCVPAMLVEEHGISGGKAAVLPKA